MDPPPPKKKKKKGLWKGPKSSKKIWGIFGVQNIIFCKLMTSGYLTEKNCRIICKNKLNFRNFFIFLFLVGIYRCFWHNFFFFLIVFFSKMTPPPKKKRGYEKDSKVPKFFGAFFGSKTSFFVSLWHLDTSQKKVADIFFSYGQKITFIREFHYPGSPPQKKWWFSRPKFGRKYFFPYWWEPRHTYRVLTNRIGLLKKKSFFVFFKSMVKICCFCENSHFFKNNGQKWGVRRDRNFCSMAKI